MAAQQKEQKLTVKQEQARLIKTIGTRMKQARELCNLSQTEAAKRLGYSNPSKLSKVENATDTMSVPLWLLLRAAKVYEVSLDFLFGVSDTFDESSRVVQQREVSSWLFDCWQKQRCRDITALRFMHNRLEGMGTAAALMFEASDRVADALRVFRELNPNFIDLKAGSRLVSAVQRSEESVRNMRNLLARFRLDCRRATNAESLQPQLPFDDGDD